ncbi:KAP family P-loop NTPase fold protein [Robinsoniella peoriensis]
MYLEDAPIEKQDEDLLNRRNFAKRLGRSIIGTNTKKGFSIGLYGPWGSGKSSLVNMIIEEINNSIQEDKPIIMYFNPWNFSSTNQLLQQYFIMLANEIADVKTEKMSQIGKEIYKYAEMLDSFGTVGKLVATGGKVVGDMFNEKAVNGTNDLTKQKDIIVELLSKQERKLIIIIDDIDRLSNEEIKLIFQLVNTVAKFPNTTYLLSFDKDIVARALTAVQNYDGEKYLEKIIQVPINIPDVSNDYLWKALFDKLDSIFESHYKMVWNPEYWNAVFTKCVSEYVSNIRDIIRLSNALSIKVDMVGDEINYADMIGMTVIENHLPDLYKWIKFNKEILTGEGTYWFAFSELKPNDFKKQIKDQLEVVESGNGDKLIELLVMFFPFFASKINAGHFDEKELRRNQRVGHPDKFDLYFSLDIDSVELTRAEFEYAIYSMNKDNLKDYIHQVIRRECTISFLKELAAVVDTMDSNRAEILIKVLFETAVLFQETEQNVFLSLPGFEMAEYRIRELFSKVGDDQTCYNILVEITEHSDFLTIQALASFLNTTELAFGRLAAKGQNRSISKLITLEQLEKYEAIFLLRLKQIGAEGNLLEMKNARMLLYLYECFDESEYKLYMERQLKEDKNVLIYLSYSSNKWTGSTGVSWEYSEDYKKFLNDMIVDETISKCVEDKTIFELDYDVLQRVAAYVLWKQKIVNWNGNVTELDVHGKIESWKDSMDNRD